MGKALRSEHLTFFTKRMNEHNKVDSWELIPSDDEYLFRVKVDRYGSKRDVIVHLTDAYLYGFAEFFARPTQLRANSFVVIGMPHASADDEVIEKAKKERIGIGFIGKFMGALNYNNLWEYMTPEELRRKEERQR